MRTVTEVDAPPERVWSFLADFAHYDLWNPRVGAVVPLTEWSTRLKFRLRRPGKRSIRLTGSVLELVRPRVIKWAGGHPLWGLLRVTHTIVLAPVSGGGTRVEQTAKVGGLLKRRAVPAAEEAMSDMGAALKQAAQAAAASRGQTRGVGAA